MPLFDMPLEELQRYRPARQEPADFDSFWKATLEMARSYDLKPRFEPVDIGLTTLDVYDVSFAGFDGQPVKGWYMLPRMQRPGCRRWWSLLVMAVAAAIRWNGWLFPRLDLLIW